MDELFSKPITFVEKKVHYTEKEYLKLSTGEQRAYMKQRDEEADQMARELVENLKRNLEKQGK